MNIADIRAQLEAEITWRRDEIRLLANQLVFISKDEDQRRFRKSLVVMLYAHYEGFCKVALSIYVEAINQANVMCVEATPCIVAGALSNVFQAYENRDKKNEVFKTSLPNDEKLHRFARQVDLITELSNIMAQPVTLDTDEIVDTESNLKPIVMRKILYRLGFQYDAFMIHEGQIHKLLNYRNKIAHGNVHSGIDEKEYRELEKSSFDIMQALLSMIMVALQHEAYKKSGLPLSP